jgi:hypothetical protein
MSLDINDLCKNLDKINAKDLLAAWKWRTGEIRSVVLVTLLGDAFFLGNDKAVYWLQTDVGDVTRVAGSLEEFDDMLTDEETVEDWFLTPVLEELYEAGKTLKENEVYSYKLLPVLGGEYEANNIEPTDIKIHFSTTGRICEQIEDLPDGAEVDINLK